MSISSKAPKKPPRSMAPADFFSNQSARSVALAGKTKTSKLTKNKENLFADLLVHPPKHDEKPDEDEDYVTAEECEVESDFLLVRGPVTRRKKTVPHPFVKKTIEKKEPEIVRRKQVIEYSTYSATGVGYECGVSEWQDHYSPSDGRASVIATVGKPMIGTIYCSTLMTPQSSPEEYQSCEDNQCETPSASSNSEDEIPDNLVDFILQYTRMAITPKPIQHDESPQPTDSPVVSDDAAAKAAFLKAERAKYLAMSNWELLEASMVALGLVPSAINYVAPKYRPAKTNLRAHIGEEKIEHFMRLLCEEIENCKDVLKGAGIKSQISNGEILFWRDNRGNTLLHHALFGSAKELAQPYVVVEQQLLQPRDFFVWGLPWDARNSCGETPLWWAVNTMKPMFVDYLLELGADPNARTSTDREDTALHTAARRGMTAIVKSLVSDSRCDIEVENKPGDTPLFTAVLYNQSLFQKTGLRMRNEEVAEVLLKAGADPNHIDKRGNNIFHIAASLCDTPMLELFAKLIPDEISTRLANANNKDGPRPIDYLRQHEGEIDDARYRRCFFALLTCNAKVDETTEKGNSESD